MKEKNSFNEVRLTLALMVVMVHMATLSGEVALRPLAVAFNSDFAVKGFFSISGYLIFLSYKSSESLSQYLNKRMRRIIPAYLLVIFICFLWGVATTENGVIEFLTSSGAYNYLLANTFLANFLAPTLPGVFEGNPIKIVNGSLWTIKVEVMFYAFVPILCMLMARLNKKFIIVVLYALSLAWFCYFSYLSQHPYAEQLSRQLPGQLPYFLGGVLMAELTFRRVSFPLLALIFLCYTLLKLQVDFAYYDISNMIIYPIFVITLCQGTILNFGVARYGDLSYGIYLFHFPIIQALVHFGLFSKYPNLGVLTALSITILAALASWHGVEKRFLRRLPNGN